MGLDGFTYDDPRGYYNVYDFKRNYADLMRNLSNDSFFQNAEIYGDPHSGLDFGMESILPGSWNDDKEIFGWVANDIKWGNMDDLDGLFAKYYDKYADVNRDAGDLLIFPWMRQMLDPFGCDKRKNMIARAVTVAAGFLAVTEKTRKGAAWEDEWWTPDPYTGAAGLQDLAIAMENCDAFNHGTLRERLQISGGTQKQYAISIMALLAAGTMHAKKEYACLVPIESLGFNHTTGSVGKMLRPRLPTNSQMGRVIHVLGGALIRRNVFRHRDSLSSVSKTTWCHLH